MKFKVMLRGENFNVALDGPVAKLGFYTTRFVEADTPDAAEQAAVDLVRQDRVCKASFAMRRPIRR